MTKKTNRLEIDEELLKEICEDLLLTATVTTTEDKQLSITFDVQEVIRRYCKTKDITIKGKKFFKATGDRK